MTALLLQHELEEASGYIVQVGRPQGPEALQVRYVAPPLGHQQRGLLAGTTLRHW